MPADFASLETRFLKMQQEERCYGSSDPVVKSDFNRIMNDLHSFTREYLHISSFNELCDPSYQYLTPKGTHNPTNEQPVTKGGPSSAPPVSSQMYEGEGNYWAVLVGVREYEDATNYDPLPTCIDDVKAIARRFMYNGYAPQHMRLLVDGPPDKDPLIKKIASDDRLCQPSRGNIINVER